MASTRARETEEALGPLPKGWEKGVTPQGKVYFVDHNTKLTSWVDPRTIKTRKHDIREVKEGELPYGWEEAYDSVVGIYYIDHTTKSTYLDAPWDKEVQEHAVALREHLTREQKRLEAQKKLYQDKKTRLAEATRRVTDLESEKIRLEREVEVMRSQASKKESQLDQELEAELMAVKSRLEKEKAVEENETKEYNKLRLEVDEFNSRLNELRNLNDRLKREEQSQLEAAKNTEREIQEVSHLLEIEAAERSALESYIVQLTQEIMNAANKKSEPAAADKTGDQVAAEAKQEAQERIAHEPEPEPAPKNKKTNRLDMEMELLALRKRLEGEKKEKEKLMTLTHSIEAEKVRLATGNVGAIPEWIKKVNIEASNSKTLRVKIASNQKRNPDNLSFREKMLFYTAGAVESNAAPVPVPEIIKPAEHVKGPKETQYANISRGTSGVNVLENK